MTDWIKKYLKGKKVPWKTFPHEQTFIRPAIKQTDKAKKVNKKLRNAKKYADHITDFGTRIATWGTQFRPPTDQELKDNRKDWKHKAGFLAENTTWGITDMMMPEIAQGLGNLSSKIKLPKKGYHASGSGLHSKTPYKDFMKKSGKASETVEEAIEMRLEDLATEEGQKRLIQQELDYVKSIGLSGDNAVEVAKSNAQLRIKELKNTKIFNKEAKQLSRRPSFTEGQSKKFITDNELDVQSFYSNPKAVMKKNKIKTEYDAMTYMGQNEIPGEIFLDPNFSEKYTSTIHEIQHGLDRTRKLPIMDEIMDIYKKPSIIDDEAQATYNYLKNTPEESTAFLAETREVLLDQGLLGDVYENITPEKLKKAYHHFKKNPYRETAEKHRMTRALDILNPTDENFKKLSKAFNKLPAIGTGLYLGEKIKKHQKGGKASREFQDFGSRMLHGVQSFGGSYIGDAIQGVSPKAADVVSKYTAGMISPTPQSYLDKNRSSWKNRTGSAANAASMVLAGEVIGPLVGAVGKAVGRKVGPLLSKASIPNISKVNPRGSFKSNVVLNSETEAAVTKKLYEDLAKTPGATINNLRRVNEPLIRAKNQGVNWFNEWTSHPEFKKRVKSLGIKGELPPDAIDLTKRVRMRNRLKNPKLTRKELPDNISGRAYADGTMYINANNVPGQIKTTAIHEMTHAKFNNNFIPVSKHFKPIKGVPDKFVGKINAGEKVNASEIVKYKQRLKYLIDPTETHARVMQLRGGYGAKPGQFMTTQDAKIIYDAGIDGRTPLAVDWFKQMKSPLELKKMLNTFPALGVATGTYAASKKQIGGTLTKNDSILQANKNVPFVNRILNPDKKSGFKFPLWHKEAGSHYMSDDGNQQVENKLLPNAWTNYTDKMKLQPWEKDWELK